MRVFAFQAAVPAAVALSVTACISAAEDTRVPLAECDHGLYWADCGGSGEPAIGCDRETGNCRWFNGGVGARGHALSDCPTADPCCHENWPFLDFAPTGLVWNRSRDQLSLLERGVLRRQGVSDVAVLDDLSEPVELPQLYCPGGAGRFPGCESIGRSAGGVLRREGRSVISTWDLGPRRIDVEIVTDASLENWTVKLYDFTARARDSSATWCGVYSFAEELVVTGVLHVNTTDLSDLEAFHARLEGMRDNGVEFVIEF